MGTRETRLKHDYKEGEDNGEDFYIEDVYISYGMPTQLSWPQCYEMLQLIQFLLVQWFKFLCLFLKYNPQLMMETKKKKCKIETTKSTKIENCCYQVKYTTWIFTC